MYIKDVDSYDITYFFMYLVDMSIRVSSVNTRGLVQLREDKYS